MLMDTRAERGGGPQPWDDEPDLLRWRDPSTGYQCLIVRGPLRALCGYVRVPRDHWLHGREASHRALGRIRVHGGITFAGRLYARRLMKRGHWLGFDCSHFFDLVPGVERPDLLQGAPAELFAVFAMLSRINAGGQTYRTVAYVREQCAALAEQLARRRKR